MVTITGTTMGTSYSVKYYDSRASAETIKAAVEKRLARVNQLMSTYIEDSEISRFNRQPSGEWFTIAPETAQVVTAAQDLCQSTEGAFDITVSDLVDLWGFGPSYRQERVPDDARIQATLANVGCRFLEIDREPDRLLKHRALKIDLSAIAKGYAVDYLAGYLDAQHISSYLVEIGGELKTRGTKPDGQLWRIAIESPVVDQRAVHRALSLDDMAVATSGDYRNYFEREGIRYSHTIDPATGYPIKHKLASVTVISDNTMDADALATAFMVMGPERALEYADNHDFAVLFIVKDSEGFREVASAKFNLLFK